MDQPAGNIELMKSRTSSDGLVLHLTTDGSSETFERFFTGFDRAFVLPNEKEDREGFQTCLSLNHGPAYNRLSAAYGPYREICLIAEDEGKEVGGANFIAMPVTGGAITANLNYIFVNDEMRGRGYLGKLFRAVQEVIRAQFPAASADPLVFIEQNDPFRMSVEDYERDTKFTGLDQFDRLRIWARLGAKVVDFPYRQPPLSSASAADDTLLYSVLGATIPKISAYTLLAHLRLFFGVSVLKGASLSENADAQTQMAALEDLCATDASISLLNPSPLLTKPKTQRDIFSAEKFASFRDAVKSATQHQQ